MAKHNELSPEQINEICLVYDECRRQVETAQKTKHSITTVSKYLIANGRGCGQGGNPPLKITDAQIFDDIQAGYTRQEIADRHGVHVENLAKRLRKLGVHAKKAPNKGEGNPASLKHQRIYGVCWHYVKSHDDKVKSKTDDLIYLETKNDTKKMRLRCRYCGGVAEHYISSIRRDSFRCRYCHQMALQQKELSKKRIELIRFFYALAEYKKNKICAFCGNEFHSQSMSAKYCSAKCKKGKGSIRDRCRKYGVYYDPTVTPKKIFERDHYTCMICGLVCNEEDDAWGKWFGPYSPTVDHIIALANGGTHTWDNVQCAHAICNSYKRDITTV